MDGENDFFAYNGQINVELAQNYFKFYPRNGIQQLCVLYNTEEGDKLSMKITRSYGEPSIVKLTIESINKLFEKEKKFEVYMETPAIMMDTFKEEYQVFKKSLQIFGKYRISGPGKVIKAIFKHNKGIEYAVIVDKHSKVYETYKGLCEIWPLRCDCTKYCISDKNGVLAEDITFKDCSSLDKIKFKVAERCDIRSIVEGDKVFVMPWSKRSSVLIRYLANLLKVNVGEVRLLNTNHKVVCENLKLNIADFREEGTKDPLSFIYDKNKYKVKCVLMELNNEPIEVEVLRDCTALELKIKLEEKLKIDYKRVLVSQNEALLADDVVISPEEAVIYYIGSTFEEIPPKNCIGFGAYGQVLKYVLKSKEVIALKKFLIPLNDEKIGVSIIREIKVMTKIPPHENLVKYLGLYVQDNDIYIGMEYMEKGSLTNILDPTKLLEEKEIRMFSEDILKGLAHLHKNDVIHRDIKGGNVLLGVNNKAKLCDFGISRILTGCESSFTNLIGTPNFMAPEVINRGSYSFKADIWSFGATVVEMITAFPPFHEINKEYIYNKVGTEKKIVFEAKMSKSLELFVYSCLKAEPEDRPEAQDLLKSEFIACKEGSSRSL